MRRLKTLTKVVGEGECDGCDSGGSEHHDGSPAEEEGGDGSECLVQVLVLAATLGDHGAQLAVADRPEQGNDATQKPHHQTETHTARVLHYPWRSREDAAAWKKDCLY